MTITQLQEQNAGLREENAALRQQLEESRRESLLLRQKLDALARRYFDKKSEQLNSAQLELLMVGLEESQVEVPARTATTPHARTTRRERNGKQRVRTPENLEVVRQVIQPREVQAEPGPWKEISQEVSRQLDYQPGKFFWLETVRPKYVRGNQRDMAPVVAPAPQRASGLGMRASRPGCLGFASCSLSANHELSSLRAHTRKVIADERMKPVRNTVAITTSQQITGCSVKTRKAAFMIESYSPNLRAHNISAPLQECNLTLCVWSQKLASAQAQIVDFGLLSNQR